MKAKLGKLLVFLIVGVCSTRIWHWIFWTALKKNCFFFSRLKTQYENELREMERTQMASRDKYAEMRTTIAEGEASIQNFQATVKQLELQLEHSKKV